MLEEIEIGGFIDVDFLNFADTTMNGDQTINTFLPVAGHASEVSIDLSLGSGAAAGTFSSSTLEEFILSSTQTILGDSFSAAFVFNNANFASADAGTAGIVGDRFTVTANDINFTGNAGTITPADLFDNVVNGTFGIDTANVNFEFESGGTDFVENVGTIQSNPNQEFTLAVAVPEPASGSVLVAMVLFVGMRRKRI